MVQPLHRLCRAVLPQMMKRGAGKIVVMRCAALRGMRTRRLQRSARSAGGLCAGSGVEAAPHNVQVNLIAQNYVENPVYYPQCCASRNRFRSRYDARCLLTLGNRQGRCRFALFLASDNSDFFVGQAIPSAAAGCSANRLAIQDQAFEAGCAVVSGGVETFTGPWSTRRGVVSLTNTACHYIFNG